MFVAYFVYLYKLDASVYKYTFFRINKIGIFLIPKQLLVVLILRLNSFFRCRLEMYLQWYQFYFAVRGLVRSSIAFTLSLFGFIPFSLISCPAISFYFGRIQIFSRLRDTRLFKFSSPLQAVSFPVLLYFLALPLLY